MDGNKKQCKITGCTAGILCASLVVNLFLLGVVVAPMVSPRPDAPAPQSSLGISRMVERIEHDLSPADAAVLRTLAVKSEPSLNDAQLERDAAFARLGAVLKAETLDSAEIQKALDTVVEAHGRTDAVMGEFIKQVAVKLSLQGRRVMADKGLPPPRGKEPRSSPAATPAPVPAPIPAEPPSAPSVPNTPPADTAPSSDGVPLAAPAPEEGKPTDITSPTSDDAAH